MAGIETVKKVARVGRKNKIRSIVKKKGYNKSKEIVKKNITIALQPFVIL